MIRLARYLLIAIGISVGIPYVLGLIGLAKIADRRGQRRHSQS